MGRRWAALAALLVATATAEAQVVTELDGELVLGAAVHVDHVTVWPVFSKKPHEKVDADLVPLADAQAQGWAVVREQGAGDGPAQLHNVAPQQAQLPPQQRNVTPQQAQLPPQQRNVTPQQAQAPLPVQRQASVPQEQQEYVQQAYEGGSRGPTVNELVIENKGDKPILVLAGTLLKGGNQDRQVGQDFIVPAKKTVPVAAFCVEHGRWTAQREGRNTNGVFEAKKALATKSVRGAAQFEANQQKVWDKVAVENAKAGKAPTSGTFMATLEEDDAAAKARRDRVEGQLAGALGSLAREANAPVGLAYAVDGKVREVRVFSHPAVFQRLQETLLTTVAIEGDLAWREAKAAGRAAPAAAADAKQVAELVRGSAAAAEDRQHTKAGNLVKMRKAKAAWAAETYVDDKAARPVTKTYTAVE